MKPLVYLVLEGGNSGKAAKQASINMRLPMTLKLMKFQVKLRVAFDASLYIPAVEEGLSHLILQL
jgi:hypothetical protein